MHSRSTTPFLHWMRLPLVLCSCTVIHALSALDRPRSGFFETVLESNVASQQRCKPTGLIQDACCDYQSVEDVNTRLHANLQLLTRRPFFRYHKVDLYRDCPFWHEDGSCMNRACGVATADEEHIPEKWRSSALSSVETVPKHDLPAGIDEECSFRDSDFCRVDDDTSLTTGQFVDLLSNPERFTGYAGPSASKVWKAIYEENCFGLGTYIDPNRGKDVGGMGFAPLSGLHGKSDVRTLMGSLAGPRDTAEDETCLEKRVFYRLISGLHASISIHICNEYLDQATGEWVPNLECFISRIAEHPERLQNVYFNYVLMLRALDKAGPYLRQYDLYTGMDPQDDQKTRALLDGLVREASNCPGTFDEKSMFGSEEAEVLKDQFKTHFRNISRIMDCVGCDKCRLWGGLQVTGLGTALKMLFSYDSTRPTEKLHLQRSEVVAFVNTLHRFSSSLAAVERFRELWAVRDAEQQAAQEPPRKATRTSTKPKRRPRKIKLKEKVVKTAWWKQVVSSTAKRWYKYIASTWESYSAKSEL